MEKLQIIRTAQELNQLKHYIEDKEYISFDVETDGTGPEARIIGFSISAEENVGFYVVTAYWDVQNSSLINTELQPLAKEFIQLLKDKQLIMHNTPFDCSMVWNNYKISLVDSVHTDTLMLAHLLDENRSNGLKELGAAFFGQDAKKEQAEMKESVSKNGGVLTHDKYELYKADSELIGRYGAKDAILTLNLFYIFVEQLYKENLDKFFYEDETMPLLKGPTYEMNTTGLKIDTKKLEELKGTIEAECLELKAFIHREIQPFISEKYPGLKKKDIFNFSSNNQLAWLLFEKLDNDFHKLTDAGKEMCKELNIKAPYTSRDKKNFVQFCKENLGRVYSEAKYNPKTGKYGKPKKIGEFWKYTSTDEESLSKYKDKYNWVGKLLKLKENLKILDTYISGIQSKIHYGVVKPRFIQNGTTSGRYSSRDPNFQNLPRDDKRIKSCIISRPGKVFVGADYSQLEPRVFASVSQDPKLMSCFEKGEDFYSLVGIPIFEKFECSAYKKGDNAFAVKYTDLRNVAKAFALATPYGTSAWQQSRALHRGIEECEMIIERYFASYPKVELMMLESHEEAKRAGVVFSLYGRPRRIPEAKNIEAIYGPGKSHGELPYEARTLLNLAMNHRVQSSAASIVNRGMIAFYNAIRKEGIIECKIVMQVHDEIIVECLEKDAKRVSEILKHCMENTTILPGVKLVAEPEIANNIADLK